MPSGYHSSDHQGEDERYKIYCEQLETLNAELFALQQQRQTTLNMIEMLFYNGLKYNSDFEEQSSSLLTTEEQQILSMIEIGYINGYFEGTNQLPQISSIIEKLKAKGLS